MSSRAMKKLLRDEELRAPPVAVEVGQDKQELSDEEQEEPASKRPPARNLFALLGGDDEQEDDEDQEKEDEEIEEAPKSAPSASKKKKNKKKKKTATALSASDGGVDSAAADGKHPTAVTALLQGSGSGIVKSFNDKASKKSSKKGLASKTVEDMSIEEFEKSLQQANQQLGELDIPGSTHANGAGTTTMTPLKALMAVDTRFLDADAEMKKLFGARVVNSEIKDRRYTKATRKALMAQPRAAWPIRKASGLSMDLVETVGGGSQEAGKGKDSVATKADNVSLFKIVHSDHYQKVQLDFLRAVASYDPNNLAMLLRANPFHIDTLLQLSEVSKHNGDHSLAGEFIEQALFAFEKSFHSLFNIASGAVRLDFMQVENRSFFLALHRHIQFLGRRGCWRTGFEFNKLLLSLDPIGDELGALLSIDFYACKAQEYEYLQNLYDRLKPVHGLDKLPNFAYSLAMARFQLERREVQKGSKGSSSTAPAVSPDHSKSSELLQRAIVLFPTAILLLADQGGFSVDQDIAAGEAHFYPSQDLPKILDLLVHLFVARNFALWKEPEVISWLKTNLKVAVQMRFSQPKDKYVKEAALILAAANKAAATKNSGKEYVPSYSFDGTLDAADNDGDENESSVKETGGSTNTVDPQHQRGSDPSRMTLRVARHVLVSEHTTLANYLPKEIVTATTHMHDPLPPRGSRNIYEERFEEMQQSSALGSFGLMGGARDAAQNVLADVVRMFRAAGGVVRGNGGPSGDDDGQDGLAGGGGIGEAQLRQIAEAVQRLQAQYGAGAMPGAFQGPGIDGGGGEGALATEAIESAEGTAGTEGEVSLPFLAEMMRRVGLGGGGGVTGEPTNVDAYARYLQGDISNDDDDDDDDEDYVDGQDEGEDDEDEYFEGEEDSDGEWAPYDPAAYA